MCVCVCVCVPPSSRWVWHGLGRLGLGPSLLVPSWRRLMWRTTAVALNACCRDKETNPIQPTNLQHLNHLKLKADRDSESSPVQPFQTFFAEYAATPASLWVESSSLSDWFCFSCFRPQKNSIEQYLAKERSKDKRKALEFSIAQFHHQFVTPWIYPTITKGVTQVDNHWQICGRPQVFNASYNSTSIPKS